MDGVSLQSLFALQQMNIGSNVKSVSSTTSEAFAAMLENELSDNSTAGSLTSSASTEDIQKQMMLSMCLMMCGGTLGSSPAMASLLSTFMGSITEESSDASTGKSIVDSALTRLGDPYSKTYRGTGKYVDCSYLAQWAYKQQGISIPGTAAAQAKYCHDKGYTISKDELQPGDLVFWTKKGCDCGRWQEIHHVGIYAGNGKVVEAKGPKKGVEIDNIWESSKWKIAMYARPYAN